MTRAGHDEINLLRFSPKKSRSMWPAAALVGLIALGGALIFIWGQPRQSASLDTRVRAVATQLRCPVCQGESVYDAPAPLAGDMRAIIRRQLKSGLTPDQVKAYFVSKYGGWILLSPPASGIGYLVWAAPIVLMLIGLGVLGVLVVRWQTGRSTFNVQRSTSGSRVQGLRFKVQGSERRAAARSERVNESRMREAERDELVVRLERIEDDLADGSLSAVEAAAERRLVLDRLAELERTDPVKIGGTGGPKTRRSSHGALTAAALLALAVIAGASLALAVQPRAGTSAGNAAAAAGASSKVVPADIERAARGVESHPRRAGAWITLGAVLVRHQDYVAAGNAYENAIRLRRSDVRGSLGLAFVDILTAKPKASLPLLRNIERREPRSPRAWLLQGLAFSRLGERAPAIAAWNRFLNLQPRSALSDQVRTWIARESG